jgi:DNA-binding transcriptional ArsR family regulator
MERLGGITPKTLTQRLRELEDDGIVAVDREPGRREVWYRLTPAGADLGPVVNALSGWALQHAWRWPQAGEPLHAEHLLGAVVRAIDLIAGDHEPARWHFRIDGADYLIESDGHQWALAARAPDGPADVTITATTLALAPFIFGGTDSGAVRRTDSGAVSRTDSGADIVGEDAHVQRFRRLAGTIAARLPELGGSPFKPAVHRLRGAACDVVSR